MQQPPERIDKYQIHAVLGKGAMGIVYHAYDPIVKRDVAIKLLSSLDTDEPELISRFEREARLAGQLRHPNVVTIYDLGHFEGRPYIVMEYILGRDLETVIKERQPLDYEQRVEIVLQICKGLDAAHQKGIIHRDIKPANIRLQEDNTVKIMDFGIARMGTSQLTRSGYIIGTLQYMSPEQVSGEQLDPRTDLFSAGVIAYELFTSSNPFSGGGAVDIMYRIMNVRPQPIQNLPEEYGSELNQVIMRALEKNRDLRYPNAKEMVKDLEEFLFYIKSLKFRPKLTARNIPYGEGITRNIPADQIPVTQPRAPDIPATVTMDVQNRSLPTFGVPQQERPEKVPRTGVGANYSETGQVLMKQAGAWHEKKFYILGAIVALLFISGLMLTASLKSERSDSLAIKSSPPGAEVWVGDEQIGKAPVTVPEKKDMALVFRLKGYREKTVNVSREAWPKEVNVNLEPIPVQPEVAISAAIKVESTPAGAAVLIDGEEKGMTPHEVTLPDDKPHRLALKLEGYKTVEQAIDKTTPKVLSLQLQAQETPGYVKYVGSYPVTIFVGGQPVKGTTISLEPGTYSITVKTIKGVYIKSTKTVEVKSDQTAYLQAPAMGYLNLKANPSNCKVSINGDFIDYVPINNLPIQAGPHQIQFNWEKLGKRLNKPVVIEPDQTETVAGTPE